jgi:hypothetical protein
MRQKIYGVALAVLLTVSAVLMVPGAAHAASVTDRAVGSLSASRTQVTPATFTWMLYGYYPSLPACESVGQHLEGMGLAAEYACVYGGPPPFQKFWALWIFTSIT